MSLSARVAVAPFARVVAVPLSAYLVGCAAVDTALAGAAAIATLPHPSREGGPDEAATAVGGADGRLWVSGGVGAGRQRLPGGRCRRRGRCGGGLLLLQGPRLPELR